MYSFFVKVVLFYVFLWIFWRIRGKENSLSQQEANLFRLSLEVIPISSTGFLLLKNNNDDDDEDDDNNNNENSNFINVSRKNSRRESLC